MLKISQAALIAATLGLSGGSSLMSSAALAQDSSSEMASSDEGGDVSSAEAATTTTTSFSTTVTIQSVAAVGSNMDEGAIRDALSGDFSKHVEEIAKLTATSITIPEIDVTFTRTGSSPQTQTVAFKDVELTDVKDGVAGSASLGSIETSNPEGSLKLGKLSASDMDFDAMLAIYGLVASTGGTEMTPLYKNLTLEGGSLTTKMGTCTLGKISAPEVDMRPLKVSFADMMRVAGTGGDTPSPEATRMMALFLTDYLQAFKSEPATFGGVSCTGTDEKGAPIEFSIGGIETTATTPGIYPGITVSNVKIVGNGDTITLDKFVLKPIDFGQPIAAVEAQGDAITAQWINDNYRKMIPAFEGFSFSGFAVSGVDPQSPGTNLDVKIANFDLSLGNYLNGIPTRIATSASGIESPLPADSSDEQIKALLALGVTRVNLGFDLSTSWDKDTQTINVDKVAVTGKDLGSVAVAAVIGNAAEQLFDTDPNVMQAAAMGVTLKSLKLDLTDAGLSDKLVPNFAAQQGTDPATFRSQIAGVAAGTALQLLGATDAGKALSDAVAAFVTGTAKSLDVTITAKDAAGLPLPVLMQASDNPTVLANAVTIAGASQ